MYVPPQRVWFLRPFGLKTGIDFAHLGLELGTVLEGTRRSECMNVFTGFNSKSGRKKENYANSKCILRNLFLFYLVLIF